MIYDEAKIEHVCLVVEATHEVMRSLAQSMYGITGFDYNCEEDPEDLLELAGGAVQRLAELGWLDLDRQEGTFN